MSATATALALVRRKMGVTQAQLAAMCGSGIDQKLVSMIETCRVNPYESEMNLLAMALGYNEDPKTLLLDPDEWVKKYGKSYGFKIGQDTIVLENARQVLPDEVG